MTFYSDIPDHEINQFHPKPTKRPMNIGFIIPAAATILIWMFFLGALYLNLWPWKWWSFLIILLLLGTALLTSYRFFEARAKSKENPHLQIDKNKIGLKALAAWAILIFFLIQPYRFDGDGSTIAILFIMGSVFSVIGMIAKNNSIGRP